MNDDPTIVDAAAVAAVEPPPEPAVDPVDLPVTPPPAGPPAWYMQTINAERERAAAAERRAAEAEALAQRLAATKPPEGQQSPPVPPVNETQRQAEIQAAARQQRFYEDTVEVRQKGIAQFGAGFNDTLNILNSLGVASDNEFIADVLAVDKYKAHEILASLAKDPEKAVDLTKLNSRQRIAELTRMTMTQAATSGAPAAPAPAPTAPAAPKTTSKAPAPAPAVTPSTTTVKDWRQDDSTEEEFNRGFEEMMERRNARR